MVKLSRVVNILKARPLVNIDDDLEVYTVCGADLMSDVLVFSQQKTLLLTGLTNPQVIRTAEMIDIEAIIFVRGKKPPHETIELAREKNINIFYTAKSLFEACGLLYENGLRPEKMEGI